MPTLTNAFTITLTINDRAGKCRIYCIGEPKAPSTQVKIHDGNEIYRAAARGYCLDPTHHHDGGWLGRGWPTEQFTRHSAGRHQVCFVVGLSTPGHRADGDRRDA